MGHLKITTKECYYKDYNRQLKEYSIKGINDDCRENERVNQNAKGH